MIYLDLEGKAPIFANASKVTHALFKDTFQGSISPTKLFFPID